VHKKERVEEKEREGGKRDIRKGSGESGQKNDGRERAK